MFENNLIAGVSGQSSGGYSIDNSLRFNDDDSAYLRRTPATAGNRKTWTWSGWVKRGNLAAPGFYVLFEARNAGSAPYGLFYFYEDGVVFNDSVSGIVGSSAKLRDTSGWYHLICVLDTTQATASDRVKMYVNGEQITSFSTATYPSLNQDLTVNTTYAHGIGAQPQLSDYFDGYMAEVNFIDGQALTPDDFGEINARTGEWSPIPYEGTYGTNGFYLPFDGNANDDSGNGNNWTENNLASTDYMIDTPSTNFSVLNSVAQGSYVTLSEGNLKTTGNTATDSGTALPTMFVNEGLFYWETCVASVGSGLSYAGFVQTNAPIIGTTSAETIGTSYGGVYRKDGNIYGANRAITTTDTYTAGDIIGIALDMANGAAYASKNNTWLNGGVPASGASKTGAIWSWTPSSMLYANGPLGAAYNGEATVLNFGADSSFAGNKTRQGNTDANGKGDFYYAPPAGGYLALCTDNLPAPTIEQPETQFNVVTYTGNGTSQAITGVGFQPDMVWIKVRSTNYDHQIHDSVRGGGLGLLTNATDAEADYNTVTSFDSDGFTVNVEGSFVGTNASGQTFVAWCWKAGGTAVSNTDGSITSQVSANVDAGFSIISYTGTGANATVGHGLSSAPEMMIVKDRDSTFTWRVYHASLANTQVLYLSATDAATTETAAWNSTSPTSTVLSLGTSNGTNGSSNNFIAYCFHSVESFSKIGSFVGNGSANGPFVYTGFKVAFIMYKRATGGTGNWIISDNMREGYNWDNPALYANLILEESSGSSLDILSNGFKINNAVAGSDHNANGSTYIYMAFAEHPFNYATGR